MTTYKAKGFEAENNTFSRERPYNTSFGVAFSNSPKKALAEVRRQIRKGSKGWTPICREIKMWKNGVLIFEEF